MLAVLKANIIPPIDITCGQLEELKYVKTKDFLYVRCRGSNNTNLKLRYKRYCRILRDIIKNSKRNVLWRINI